MNAGRSSTGGSGPARGSRSVGYVLPQGLLAGSHQGLVSSSPNVIINESNQGWPARLWKWPPCRVCVCQWPMRVRAAVAHIAQFGAHPGRAWPFMPHPRICHSAPGIWDLGSLIEGLARVMGAGPAPTGRAVANRLAVVLTLAAAPPAWPLTAARGVRPSHRRRSATVPACTAGPSLPPIRDAVDTSAPRDGQELIPKRTNHSGPADRGRRGVWAFRRRPSAAVRRRRSGSILAVSVVRRRRKAAHRCARRAMFATAARCRRGRRWPAACRRG